MADFIGGFGLWVDDEGNLCHTYSLLGVETYKQVSGTPIPTGDGGQVRGRHRRIPGQSYGRDEYEAIVPFVLERICLGAKDIEDAAHAYARGTGAEPNQLRLARIEDERERALSTYRRDRDPLALERTMNDLDAAEAEALGDRELPGLPPDEVRRYLEHLPAWWADADPDDRRALATTLFERIRVLERYRSIRTIGWGRHAPPVD